MKRNHVSASGIAYLDVGEGPAVLLIHAFGFDADMWEPQFEAMRSTGTRVIASDHRGFGASPPPRHDFDFAQVVEDIIEVMDDAGVSRVLAAGVSMGSATAVALALAEPSRVAGLVLADNARPDGPDRGSAAAARIRALGTTGLADFYEPILFGDHFRDTRPDYIADWRQRLAALDADVLATIVEPYHARPDPGPHLANIHVPAAIIFGSEDAAIPEDRRGDYLSIPGATRHEINNAGHMSSIERPEEFNAILLDTIHRSFPNQVPAEGTSLRL